MLRQHLAAGLLFAALTPATAQAVPVLFQFESTILSTEISGLNAGDTMRLRVVMDNGGSSLISQQWNFGLGHFVSGTLSAGGGAYTADYGTVATLVNFQTNSAGTLIAAGFRDIGGANVDNTDSTGGSGSPIGIGGGSNNIFTNANMQGAIFTPSTAGPSGWTFDLLQVPEPAALGLFGLGLVGFGLAQRKHRPA